MNTVTMMADADFPEKPTRDSEIATAVLRASLTSRCNQAGVALASMVVMAAIYSVLLSDEINLTALILSLAATSGLLLVRYFIAVRAKPLLEMATEAELKHIDTRFRLVSLMSQLVTGAAIWVVWGVEEPSSAYVMTLLICFYAVGAMINLAHDARSFQMTAPVMMAQPILYWLISNQQSVPIALSLGALTLLMMSAARNSQLNFVESVRIRFEKDDLLGQVERALQQTESANREKDHLLEEVERRRETALRALEQTELANREKDQLLEEVERRRETALRALEQAEEANRAKSFFMAAASHDLRQPLYAATIVADTLALHELSPKAAQLLEQQRQALSAARSLFDNLLDLSSFESGAIQPKVSAVSLKELLRNIDAEFSALCDANGLTFTVATSEHFVFSDYSLLDRLVRNLLSNAVRYTKEGGVSIEVLEHEGSVTLTVVDTGIGIAPEHQERVFQEFVQLHNPQRSRDRGAGLGLSIVRHISKLLEHKIGLESEVGRGTRMSIHMPQATAVSTTQEVKHSAPYIDLRGREVWIIEDDPGVRGALTEYFRARGCVVGAASESRGEIEELVAAQGGNPDYVLIDDMLSEHEFGLDVAHWLSKHVAGTRIMIMTGGTDPKRVAALQDCPFEVMRKPISSGSLNEWVAKVNSLAQ